MGIQYVFYTHNWVAPVFNTITSGCLFMVREYYGKKNCQQDCPYHGGSPAPRRWIGVLSLAAFKPRRVFGAISWISQTTV